MKSLKDQFTDIAPYGKHRVTFCINKTSGRMQAFIYTDEGRTCTFRSRYLMQIHLGRFLDSEEDVHHKDEDKTNDVIDNLEVIDHRKHANLHKFTGTVETKCSYCGTIFQSSK
jgi:hypothetical protein